MASPFTTPELLELIVSTRAQRRPLLFGNARVVTGDSLIGSFDRGDVLLGGARVVGIGPGLLTAADDDGAVVIDCDGHVIVPVTIDVAAAAGLRPRAHRSADALAPGNAATFAVVPAVPGEDDTDTARRYAQDPSCALVVVIDGEVVLWDGVRIAVDHAETSATASEAADADHYLGTWIDENDFVHQHLTADGRYDETRGGRPHAYQGSFWITGDRIDYRDDLGFWAFGEFSDGVLHHAGYTFHRA